MLFLTFVNDDHAFLFSVSFLDIFRPSPVSCCWLRTSWGCPSSWSQSSNFRQMVAVDVRTAEALEKKCFECCWIFFNSVFNNQAVSIVQFGCWHYSTFLFWIANYNIGDADWWSWSTGEAQSHAKHCHVDLRFELWIAAWKATSGLCLPLCKATKSKRFCYKTVILLLT